MSYLPAYVLVSLFLLFNVYLAALAEISGHLNRGVKIPHPTTVAELNDIVPSLKRLAGQNPSYVALLISSAIVYSRAFCMPSNLLLRYAAGAVFPTKIALPLVSAALTCGSACSYFLALHCVKPLLLDQFQERIDFMRRHVQKNPRAAVFLITGLTIFPLSPTYLINILSPLLDVPVGHFVVSAFFGSLPEAVFLVDCAKDLPDIEHTRDFLTTTKVALNMLLGMAIILPGVWLGTCQISSSSTNADACRITLPTLMRSASTESDIRRLIASDLMGQSTHDPRDSLRIRRPSKHSAQFPVAEIRN
ncbi:unnamed protein product [Notodromas monacha]|uniref:VTT domain-containing protein n=1 Tax=Notodromas monacha TaxID=399045 RepID=A0A7R9BJV1_9CRUS|nr:unnamed protein product [Notodromas monacha]CAG0915983.1 unnamed protein product [Notodromas monacha]